VGDCSQAQSFRVSGTNPLNASKQQILPVTVIGGYLGAGKTTLVNHMLRNANGLKLAIMVNEFGELPIDADLIEAEDDNLISLAGGCICCSYGNDMVSALMELSNMEPRPDHVVLESSGVAIPNSIAGAISIMDGYSMDGIVVLVDAMTVLERASDPYLSDTILRQLSDSNIILLNKTDLVSEDSRLETQAWLAGHAPNAQIIPTQNAQVPLNILLQEHGIFDPGNIRSTIRHVEGFKTHVIEPGDDKDAYRLGQEIINQNPKIIRAKGFMKDISGTMKTIQIVGKQVDVYDAPANVKPGIVLILNDQK